MALIYLGYKALKKKMGDGEEEPELTEVGFLNDARSFPIGLFCVQSDWLRAV